MATTADAEIILKLYDLRREPEMRRARDYIGGEFWPESFEGLWKEIGMTGDKNRWFRQVYGYWEMAARRSCALHENPRVTGHRQEGRRIRAPGTV